MDYDNGFILQKTVDWSLLNDGMTSIIIRTPKCNPKCKKCTLKELVIKKAKCHLSDTIQKIW